MEKIDLYDADRIRLGKIAEKEAKMKKGEYRMVVHLLYRYRTKQWSLSYQPYHHKFPNSHPEISFSVHRTMVCTLAS